MPFVLIVVAAFLLALLFRVRASGRVYALFLVAGVVATWYFMR